MSSHYHAVVWIDHHEALVIHFNADAAEERHLHPVDPPRHLHVKAGGAAGTHITDEPSFYRDVCWPWGWPRSRASRWARG